MKANKTIDEIWRKNTSKTLLYIFIRFFAEETSWFKLPFIFFMFRYHILHSTNLFWILYYIILYYIILYYIFTTTLLWEKSFLTIWFYDKNLFSINLRSEKFFIEVYWWRTASLLSTSILARSESNILRILFISHFLQHFFGTFFS